MNEQETAKDTAADAPTFPPMPATRCLEHRILQLLVNKAMENYEPHPKSIEPTRHLPERLWRIATTDETRAAYGTFEKWLWVLTNMDDPYSDDEFWGRIEQAKDNTLLYAAATTPKPPGHRRPN
jgi:hypothetical protein